MLLGDTVSSVMEFVHTGLLIDLSLDLMHLGTRYPPASSVWRYMCCIRHYPIHTIIIGQNPYESGIVPYLGSAFSQTEESGDTPSVKIFSEHFHNKKEATDFMRRSWSMLRAGIAFVNADYYPSSLGGGNSDVDCALRINRTVEFLFYSVISRSNHQQSIKVMCAGNMAASCGSTLSRRFRYVGIKVTQSIFKQPVFLNRITHNRNLIGKQENYKFCSDGILDKLKSLIACSDMTAVSKESSILLVAQANMSDERINPMTKSALGSIAGDLTNITEKLQSKMALSGNLKYDAVHDDLRVICKDITHCVSTLVAVLTADAFTYKVLTDELTSQLPIASREQFSSNDTEFETVATFGSDVDSSITNQTPVRGGSTRSDVNKASSLFAFTPPPSTNKKLRKKKKKKQSDTPNSVGMGHALPAKTETASKGTSSATSCMQAKAEIMDDHPDIVEPPEIPKSARKSPPLTSQKTVAISSPVPTDSTKDWAFGVNLFGDSQGTPSGGGNEVVDNETYSRFLDPPVPFRYPDKKEKKKKKKKRS